MKKFRILLLVLLICSLETQAQEKKLFNNGWQFIKDADTSYSSNLLLKNTVIAWQNISLPHTAQPEPIQKVAQQWEGVCLYRKFFVVPMADKGRHIALEFEAAMQEADVYVNGRHAFNHKGGYLPFYIDVSALLLYGKENSIVVKLDNRYSPVIPPAKPLKDLDFNYYSGIYRNVWMITKNKLHFTNAIAANKTAGGGLFVHFENVSNQSATVLVKADVKNDDAALQTAQVKLLLKDKAGKVVAETLSRPQSIEKGGSQEFAQALKIINPNLWSPANPYLYSLSVQIVQNGKLVDEQKVPTGIRSIRFEAGAFYINEQKLNIRGTNRHQEYPYIGNALSDNAQYRDAWKIKDAGFNFVRCSHYPQSPAFLDACDELGIMVMDGIPGWQFFGNNSFQQNSYQDVRDMIRRDRNHAAVILWEASLNESAMSKEYMQRTHEIVHEELPFKDAYSSGWLDAAYDVFIPARQHAKAPDYWNKYKKQKPLLIAEYGDWEYYAGNAGFNQKDYSNLLKEEKTSRQLRGQGQKRLLQQALNFQESHNDNLRGIAVGDANWVMFDYKRGYADDLESSGIMDIVRLPKFAFYFYQSQVDPSMNRNNNFGKPMLQIANYWQEASDTVVKIYSNCQAVELFVNGISSGRQSPDKDPASTNLKHPPFTFQLSQFKAGTIKAVGYINSKKVVQSAQSTAGKATGIRLRADISGKPFKANQNDVIFVYAEIIDAKGNIVHNASNEIDFSITGDAAIVGEVSPTAEAGIATILLKAGTNKGNIKIIARAAGLKGVKLVIAAN